ncbi:hypothetical protein L9F63_020269, partial [Diploptera punctata]
ETEWSRVSLSEENSPSIHPSTTQDRTQDLANWNFGEFVADKLLCDPDGNIKRLEENDRLNLFSVKVDQNATIVKVKVNCLATHITTMPTKFKKKIKE